MASFSTTFRDQVLNGSVPTPVFVSVNTADPGTTGANEKAGVTRQSATVGTSTSNSGRVLAQVTLVPGGSVTHYSVWSALTGGTFLWGDALGSTQTTTFLLTVTLTD